METTLSVKSAASIHRYVEPSPTLHVASVQLTLIFQNVPIFWLRFVPALFGSFLVPVTYNLLLQLRINRWVAAMGGLLVVFGNSPTLFAHKQFKVQHFIFRQCSPDTIQIRPNGTDADLLLYLRAFVFVEIPRM